MQNTILVSSAKNDIFRKIIHDSEPDFVFWKKSKYIRHGLGLGVSSSPAAPSFLVPAGLWALSARMGFAKAIC